MELEYAEIKRHKIYGYKLIKKIQDLPQSIALVALSIIYIHIFISFYSLGVSFFVD